MFIAMKNMLQHAKIGMYGLTTLPPVSTFRTLLGRMDRDQLRFVYFGVHCNISANIYIADFTHILSPTTFKPALRSMVPYTQLLRLRLPKHSYKIIGSATVALLILLLLLAQRCISGLLRLYQLILIPITQYNVGGQLFKYLTDILTIFGTRLHKFQPVLLSQHFTLFACYLAIVLHICLRCYQDHVGLGGADLANLVYPTLDVRETSGVCDGVGQYDTMRAFIERLRDISKSFLASSIPDVQRDLRPIDLYSFNLEVYSDSTKIISLEGILTIPHQQTSLAYPTITYNKILQGDTLLRIHYQFKLLLYPNTIKYSLP